MGSGKWEPRGRMYVVGTSAEVGTCVFLERGQCGGWGGGNVCIFIFWIVVTWNGIC